jgi:hypothetical protein
MARPNPFGLDHGSGIPTEESLQELRQSDPPVSYLVGTPRARWDQFKDELEKCRGKNCATPSKSN